MDSQNKHEDTLPSDEKIICPNCAHLNEALSTFCIDCGAPIGRLAAVNPVEIPQTQGFIYRQVVDARPKLVVLLGSWLIFTGPIALCVGIVYTTAEDFSSGNIVLNVAKILVSGMYAVLFVRVLLKVTKRFLGDQHEKPHETESQNNFT